MAEPSNGWRRVIQSRRGPNRSRAAFPLVALALLVGAACRPGGEPEAAWEAEIEPPWVLLLPTAEAVVAMDTSTAFHGPLMERVRLRTDYRNPQVVPDREPAVVYSQMITEHNVDCDEGRVSDIAVLLLGQDGVQVGGTLHDDRVWLPFAEHPWGDVILPRACAYLAELGHRTPGGDVG
jgi:hypothetical protein